MSRSNFQQGDRVRVKKGAPVTAYGSKGSRVQGRSMVVTVDHVRRGFQSRSPEVVWAGSGGYWTSTSFEWVEAVE